jgi:hypothetical protein
MVKTSSDSILRHAACWLLLPVAGYICSIPMLGPGALFVPVVIGNAPLGIIAFFDEISLRPARHQQMPIIAIHSVFWLLFLVGLAGRASLPLIWLRMIWSVIALAIVMSIAGCAMQIGPGLSNEGNWH